MNDRQNPYDPYYQQPQIIGYDEYGQPVYQQQPEQQTYDPYAQQPQQPDPYGGQGYGYDPYAQQRPPAPPQPFDPYAAGPQPAPQQDYGYDRYGYDTGQQPVHDTGQQPAAVDTTQQWSIPQQAATPGPAPAPAPVPDPAREPGPRPGPEAAVPGQRRGDDDYRTEQFAFIEEPDEDSEDVIDWLKFTESRSERREEARRRGRNRIVALLVIGVLVVLGGVGYLWSADKIPGLSGGDGKENTATTGPQRRDVIVVHLHNTKTGATSTALLVDNVTTKQGTTVLLPNSLAVSNEDGTTTTLGKSVEDDGTSGTRDSLDTLLGTDISGTWRLDTPYLENLVDLVGNIEVDTDTAVPGAKKGSGDLVKKGEAQTLSGQMAVAYATYRGPGEAEAKQLMRFGQVMRGVLRKMSDDPQAATVTVQTLAQILDPSLPEKDLGASLAKLAEHAKIGDYKTALLPVQDDGTLTDAATESVVKDILGGRVKAPSADGVIRVGIKNATGDTGSTESARGKLVNGGFAFVNSGKADAASASQVVYAEAADKEKATQVAKTLGLPTSTVKKGKPAGNADVSVLLGQDYKPE